MTTVQIDTQQRRRLANAIRFLAIDGVQAANSGHPGAPMGMADIAEVLWRNHLHHNPANPHWANRDRFVLSNGHGSMLIYALLHLTGYDLPIEELKRFRQLHSKTPGHPEVGYTPGVETTTGPLGQGIANGVGMALAEKVLAAQFNQPGHAIVDHHTYVFLGDGCLMEGISHEVCSLAGTLKLNKLIAYYDDNGISIDGHVEHWFSDNTAQRFQAYGWNVIGPIDGHDAVAVEKATAEAKTSDKPTLVICRTTIGWGSPNKAGTHDVHGAALGQAEADATRKALGWDYGPFEIPADIYQAWDAKFHGAKLEADWNERFAAYEKAHSALAAEFKRRMAGDLPADWGQTVQTLYAKAREVTAATATRKSSQIALETLVPALPGLFGGSADLTGSNLTAVKASHSFEKAAPGTAFNYLSYGVREFGMVAMMNGMALHGGFLPYGGTFLMFSDYSRNGVRMSALMKQRVIHVFSHDSIGLGEDGPTHQPIEQPSSLRLIPNLDVWRPADVLETAVAWKHAIERKHGPSALLLSRQNLVSTPHPEDAERTISRGGYVLSEAQGGKPQIVLIATGSEVEIALKAQGMLAEQGVAARVVSMPCTNAFDRQDAAYRNEVLPAGLPRVAIEAGHPDFWHKYVGLNGGIVGIATFGESAPAPQLYQYFKVTAEHAVAVAKSVLQAA
ncbi:transketolase 1, thiamin-binding [Thiomonas arsenitoxydans]|uniref:Transketolase n=1 Tax=Thiomonas arsenitoxydans (strain DSM 22701 / CIP 110005 / 3As) TaxID=426114 RepID=D6CQM3_THIA3|nr:transketolase [Thiomonas arsenitoxydans]CAZ86914.1 Transketolase 1 (TK 1) [Thiomonas arsenitoxydans]CQR27937.1 transketolase 1, thiamin-binding [Thiomonas arsenitoxydans]CQR30389.1 transketolase 1, thiamin-binding [Thiomonas arsenitoxydans]CQR31980.1 transketolase 1, thiamin-binding [Thiomonas arsenitoxydans]CQR34025.1 transketolase 1, thiamin-binding [Thiomonas arsenitoxydans]